MNSLTYNMNVIFLKDEMGLTKKRILEYEDCQEEKGGEFLIKEKEIVRLRRKMESSNNILLEMINKLKEGK